MPQPDNAAPALPMAPILVMPLPALVRFSHEAVGPLAGYREVFGCPIEFNQAYSGLLIDSRLVQARRQAKKRFSVCWS